MFLKLASISGVFVGAALGFFGLGYLDGSLEDIPAPAAPRPPAVSAGAAQRTPPVETPRGNAAQPVSDRAWVDPSGAEKPRPVARAAPVEVDEQAACRATLVWANKFHVLYALEEQSGGGLDLVVGPPFEVLSRQEKEGLIRAVHCIARTGRDGPVRIRVLHWKSREMIGELVSGKLAMF